MVEGFCKLKGGQRGRRGVAVGAKQAKPTHREEEEPLAHNRRRAPQRGQQGAVGASCRQKEEGLAQTSGAVGTKRKAGGEPRLAQGPPIRRKCWIHRDWDSYNPFFQDLGNFSDPSPEEADLRVQIFKMRRRDIDHNPGSNEAKLNLIWWATPEHINFQNSVICYWGFDGGGQKLQPGIKTNVEEHFW